MQKINLTTFLWVVAILVYSTLTAEVNAFQAPSSAVFSPIREASAVTSASLAGLLGRFRKKKDLKGEIAEQITIGSPLPEVDVELAAEPVSITEVFGDAKGPHVLVGMPGAYTPTCTEEHLPGLRDAFLKFQESGVKTIAVMTTNDRFVNEAWAKSAGIIDETKDDESSEGDGPFGDTIQMLSDGDAALASALPFSLFPCLPLGFGMGIRSKRFAMILEDGLVKHLEIDDGMEDCSNTSAQRLLEVLAPPVSANTDGDVEVSTGVVIGIAAALAVAAFSMMSHGDAPTAAGAASSATSSTSFIQQAPAAQSFDLLKSYGSP